MNTSLEEMYRTHHAAKRGDGFVLLKEERGKFLKEGVGTGKRVLDIGCRDGALTATYASGNTVLGLDIDSDALARAKSALGIETKNVDLNGPWGIPDHSFDVVVAAEVVEHLYYPDTVFRKIAAALVPGGVLLGTVPNAFSLAHRSRYLRLSKAGTPLSDPTHINHFTVKELESLLAEHFADVSVIGIGRLGWLAETFPQTFAFDLCFMAKKAA
jgi:2-polyprenyl-3-methyl-5-hydroxy-6-metoxy-1,4-benzoquinol methylase